VSHPVIDRRGLLAALFAFSAWGVFPLYWAMLKTVPAWEIVAHRVVWCALFVVSWLCWRDGLGWLYSAIKQPRAALLLLASSVLISLNWGLYIWAVTHGHVVESSLGYFINPLVNVLLGVTVLGERLNGRQWVAVAFATAGVLWLGLHQDRLPWIALGLAFSFALYGLIRKKVSVSSVPGLGIESLILLLLLMAWLLWLERIDSGVFGQWNLRIDGLLVLGGIITALPLIGFAAAARRLPYSLLGILQYLSPTLQLLIGVWWFGEPFGADRLTGFALIWAALAIYAVDGVWRQRVGRAGAASGA